jgi:hypothetical protein
MGRLAPSQQLGGRGASSALASPSHGRTSLGAPAIDTVSDCLAKRLKTSISSALEHLESVMGWKVTVRKDEDNRRNVF